MLCLLKVSLHTVLVLSCELPAPATHQGTGGGPEDMEVGIRVISLASVLAVNTPLTSPESHEDRF